MKEEDVLRIFAGLEEKGDQEKIQEALLKDADSPTASLQRMVVNIQTRCD